MSWHNILIPFWCFCLSLLFWLPQVVCLFFRIWFIVGIEICCRRCGPRSCRLRWHMQDRAQQHINIIICKIKEIICSNGMMSGREPLGFNVASTNKPWKLHARTGQFFYHEITIGLTLFFNSLSLIMPSSESSVDELELDLLLLSESKSLSEPLPDDSLEEPCNKLLVPFCLQTDATMLI